MTQFTAQTIFREDGKRVAPKGYKAELIHSLRARLAQPNAIIRISYERDPYKKNRILAVATASLD